MNPGEDLSLYKLTLHEDFTVNQIDAFGQLKTGTWALKSGLRQLVLFENQSEAEHWLISELKVRRLDLSYEVSNPNKPNINARLVLVPVKGQ